MTPVGRIGTGRFVASIPPQIKVPFLQAVSQEKSRFVQVALMRGSFIPMLITIGLTEVRVAQYIQINSAGQLGR